MSFTGQVAQTALTKIGVFVQVPNQFRWKAGAQRPGLRTFFCIMINIFSRSIVIIIFFNRIVFSSLFHNIHSTLWHTLLRLISSPHKGMSHINRNTCTLHVPQGRKHIWLTHTNQDSSLLGRLWLSMKLEGETCSFPSLSAILYPQDCEGEICLHPTKNIFQTSNIGWGSLNVRGDIKVIQLSNK